MGQGESLVPPYNTWKRLSVTLLSLSQDVFHDIIDQRLFDVWGRDFEVERIVEASIKDDASHLHRHVPRSPSFAS